MRVVPSLLLSECGLTGKAVKLRWRSERLVVRVCVLYYYAEALLVIVRGMQVAYTLVAGREGQLGAKGTRARGRRNSSAAAPYTLRLGR